MPCTVVATVPNANLRSVHSSVVGTLFCRIRCDDDHVHSVDTWFDTMEKSLPRSVVDGGLSRTHTQWGPFTTQLWWSAESDRRYHPSLSQMKKPLSPHAQNSQSFNLEKYCTMLWYPKRHDEIPELIGEVYNDGQSKPVDRKLCILIWNSLFRGTAPYGPIGRK